MDDSRVNLAALIGSRICHDLISPIGAITNGLELLDLAGGVQGPELDLIADSVGNAGARIRFFRIAYGAAGDQMLGRAELVSVLTDLARSGRFSVEWMPADPKPRAEIRLAFLALQCCETAMPYGGSVRVNAENGGWTVTGRADKLNIAPAIWEGMARRAPPPDITPALVQFALLPELAADLGRRIEIVHDCARVTLRF